VKKLSLLILTFISIVGVAGCHNGSAKERFGKTYYLDGAGNWGWGTKGVVNGLHAAGYPGDVEVFSWTTSLNPLIDQILPLGGKLRAGTLAQKIARYREQYPNASVNLVGLSAGAGVALWTAERLPDNVKIDNVILLGASVSHNFDAAKALQHMNGKIYCYHSPHDGFLGPVKLIGTVDGKLYTDSAGEVGLQAPKGMESRVQNIPWSTDWIRYGWSGGHLDCASERFVQLVISRHVIERGVEANAKLAGGAVAGDSGSVDETPHVADAPHPTGAGPASSATSRGD